MNGRSSSRMIGLLIVLAGAQVRTEFVYVYENKNKEARLRPESLRWFTWAKIITILSSVDPNRAVMFPFTETIELQ